MIKKWIVGDFCINVYYNPGLNLSDDELVRLHNNLIHVNHSSGANINNKMLATNMSITEIRDYFKSTIVSELISNNEAIAFGLSPVLKKKDLTVLHIGLTIIAKNPGFNIGGLLGTANALVGYERYGHIYLTNISSTPSLIENFSEALQNTWPAPNSSLKQKPRFYKDVVKLLKDKYIDRCFPDVDKIQIDYRRFVLISNSSEMGFKTNFHQTSFANKMEYNTFCKTWINYDNEEDIIQVGEVKFWQYLRLVTINKLMRFSLAKLEAKSEHSFTSESKSSVAVTEEFAKAA